MRLADRLTGLYSHSQFQTYLAGRLEFCALSETQCSVLLIDPDQLSRVNLSKGFFAGDAVLKRISEKIIDALRDEDIAARYESSILAAVLNDAGKDLAHRAAERIRSSVELAGIDGITVSIGIASFPDDAAQPADILSRASDALQQAKIGGSNRSCAYSSGFHVPESDQIRIAIVDDNEKNQRLLEANIESLRYEVVTVSSGSDLFALLKRTSIDIVLLDVMMPGMDGFEVCRRLKSSEATRTIPVILVTVLDDIDSRVKGIEAGADDFLSKPPDKHELIARIRSLVKLKRLNGNYTSLESVLFSLANAVEANDSYTRGHTERVASLAASLGTRMNLPEEDIYALRLGGILHDIGKIGIPGHILTKPGPLDTEEMDAVRLHPDAGYRICFPLARSIGGALDIIRHHHEKLDGSSYPDGLSGEDVSVTARIMAIVDIFDALTTDRPYRKAMKNEAAFVILEDEADKNKLDPTIVATLKEMVYSPRPSGRRSGDSIVEQARILVIDDDPLNVKLIRALLQGRYEVLSENCADAAAKTARRNHPDLILLELQIPTSDGIATTIRIRGDAELRKTPIIAMGADETTRQIDEALAAGCVRYITKPIDTRQFVATIQEYILKQ